MTTHQRIADAATLAPAVGAEHKHGTPATESGTGIGVAEVQRVDANTGDDATSGCDKDGPVVSPAPGSDRGRLFGNPTNSTHGESAPSTDAPSQYRRD